MVKFRKLQFWECKACGHTFYTSLLKKQKWYRRLFRRPVRIKCEVCAEVKAKKVKIVTKEIRDETKYRTIT